MAYIGRQLVRGQNRVLDDISSSFNGSTTAFNLTVSSSSSPPASVNQLWIILGGVLQKPGTDFTVADAVLTFTTAPASTLSFWGMIQGDTSDINSPADASVTPSKIANSGDFAFPADVRFKDADGSHYVGLQAPSTVSSNLVWTLPAADGSANYLLKTDGSGTLGWAADSTTDSTKMPLAGGTFTGDVIFTGDAANLTWDKSTDDLIFNDNAKAIFGTSSDGVEIYHDGSSSIIYETGTGPLNIQTNNSNINIKGGSSAAHNMAIFKSTEGVELYYNNLKRFETGSSGIQVTGPDNDYASIDLFSDLGTHDADKFRFHVDDGGPLYIRNKTSGSWENNIMCVGNGGVSIYYDNSAKCVTTTSGLQINGFLTVGTSIPTGGASTGQICVEFAGDSTNAIKCRNTYGGNGNSAVFITGSTEVGSIVQGNSNTAYNTSSDYRLKENQVAISDGITRLKTLKPYRFNWKIDPKTTVDGFFAHEVTAVPEAIKGTKDAVATEDNENLNIKKGDPVYQQIDQSKLVPLLTAALQEAITKIETLETKVTALESA